MADLIVKLIVVGFGLFVAWKFLHPLLINFYPPWGQIFLIFIYVAIIFVLI